MRFPTLAALLCLIAGSAAAESLVSTRSGTWNGVAGGTVSWSYTLSATIDNDSSTVIAGPQ